MEIIYKSTDHQICEMFVLEKFWKCSNSRSGLLVLPSKITRTQFGQRQGLANMLILDKPQQLAFNLKSCITKVSTVIVIQRRLLTHCYHLPNQNSKRPSVERSSKKRLNENSLCLLSALLLIVHVKWKTEHIHSVVISPVSRHQRF